MEQGYVRESLVEEKGEFSIRGNIIDIFPPAEKILCVWKCSVTK